MGNHIGANDLGLCKCNLHLCFRGIMKKLQDAGSNFDKYKKGHYTLRYDLLYQLPKGGEDCALAAALDPNTSTILVSEEMT